MEGVIRFLQGRMGLGLAELVLSELSKDRWVKVDDLLVASHYAPAEVAGCVKLLEKEAGVFVGG